jgi:hypothetical protein
MFQRCISFFSWILLYWCIALSNGYIREGVALRRTFVYITSAGNESFVFQLYYSDLSRWAEVADEIANTTGLDPALLQATVQSVLNDLRVPVELLDGRSVWSEGRLSSIRAVEILSDQGKPTAHEGPIRGRLFLSDPIVSVDSGNSSFQRERFSSSWLPGYLRQTSAPAPPLGQIILYQTIGANTGGTTAMTLLHRTLVHLGYDAIICNDGNRYDLRCTQPEGERLYCFRASDPRNMLS